MLHLCYCILPMPTASSVFSLVFVCLFAGNAFILSGQQMTISGIVLDEEKVPLEGATIRLTPGNHISIADRNGFFEFTAPALRQYALYVSYIGYAAKVVDIYPESEGRIVQIHLQPLVEQLNEVVVQTDQIDIRKKEESLSIQTVGDSFIRQNLGGSLMKSLERLPGVSTIGIGSGQSKPLIRGLGFNRVVVINNGVKHEGQQWGADHGLEIDQFSVHQAEVIMGAASFMYGSDAIGGAINIKSAPVPEPESFGGSIDLVGKTNNNLYGASINLYGRKQTFFFNTRITHQDYGDYQVPTDRVYVYDFAVDLHEQHLRNSAGKEFNTHFDFGLVHEKIKSIFYLSNISSSSGFFANAHGLEPRRVDSDLHDKSNRDILYPRQEVNHFKIINSSEFYFSKDYMLKTEIGYQHNFRQEFSQYVNHGYMPPVYPEESTIPSDLEREFDKHVFTANIRGYRWFGKHSIRVGLNGEHQDNTIGGWGFLVPSFRQTTVGAFVYDKFQLNNALLLHGALRYDFGTISMFRYEDWFASETVTDGKMESSYIERAGNQSRKFNSLVWSAGLNYNKGKLGLKANIGKSFRMPIAKELGANGVNYHYFSYERGDINLDPEQSYQVDLGLNWTQPQWSASISPFYNYFPNYIYLNPTSQHDYLYGAGNQVFEYTQSKVLRYGSEIQAKWEFYKGLSLELLGEYVYARQISGDKEGYTLPFSPPASALLSLTWSPALSERLHDTFFSIDCRLTAKQNNIVPPERKTPGYQVIDLRAGTRISLYDTPIAVNLQVQNLLNTRYMNHTSFYRLIGLPEPGRNVILSIKIPFQTTKHKL